MAELHALINAAYAVAESQLWLPGKDRIDSERLAEIVDTGELAVARADKRIVGTVRVRRLEDGTGYFGLLAVDPAARGLGAGRELVRFAERRMRAEGAPEMELRLLMPHEGHDEGKLWLGEWYSRLGYRIVRRENFAETNPDAVHSMRGPLDLLTYRKPLIRRRLCR